MISYNCSTFLNIEHKKNRSLAYLFNTQQTRAFTKGFGSIEAVTTIAVLEKIENNKAISNKCWRPQQSGSHHNSQWPGQWQQQLQWQRQSHSDSKTNQQHCQWQQSWQQQQQALGCQYGVEGNRVMMQWQWIVTLIDVIFDHKKSFKIFSILNKHATPEATAMLK